MGRATAIFGAAVLVAALAASGAPATAAEYEVILTAMKFGPAPEVLKVGDVIVWRNDDIFRHTATARDKSFDVDLPPKSVRRMTVRTAGAIEYYCRFHTGMVARLDVRQ
jgi:plastocyanin